MDVDKIGLVIKLLRKEIGLSQKQLADQIGITDKAVSKWERGIGLEEIVLRRGLITKKQYLEIVKEDERLVNLINQ